MLIARHITHSYNELLFLNQSNYLFEEKGKFANLLMLKLSLLLNYVYSHKKGARAFELIKIGPANSLKTHFHSDNVSSCF